MTKQQMNLHVTNIVRKVTNIIKNDTKFIKDATNDQNIIKTTEKKVKITPNQRIKDRVLS